MRKIFNVNGVCVSDLHYMVDLENRLEAIKAMVDAGQYFTINKARQYGKTTTLRALAGYLQGGYIVVSLDFQRMSCSDFASEAAFVNGLAREIAKKVRRMENVSAQVETELIELSKNTNNNVRMADIFDCFNHWCEQSDKSIVLLVDEVDTAADNQVFLDFLAQLRACYLDRMETPTFQSVILASVYDVRNMRQKIRREEEHRQNSPWNIAAKFRVDMSFSAGEIAGMLGQYEADHDTGMDVGAIAEWIYDYSSGYPFLVSALCKYIDEEITGTEAFPDSHAAWTKKGVLEAVKRLLSEKNPLFESLIGKLNNYPEMKRMIYQLLFQGQVIAYN
ncbi:MAG: AAA-like domain-containing protein, partial [Lachnospiraceae bacterium]|nr:AAA-like domain-containing protein [Lachnospiraceae bacterium]